MLLVALRTILITPLSSLAVRRSLFMLLNATLDGQYSRERSNTLLGITLRDQGSTLQYTHCDA